MLQLTEDAARTIRELAERAGVEDGGLRITAEHVDKAEAEVTLDLVGEPEEGDAVVEEHGARVFLDQRAVELLDGKLLDTLAAGDGPPRLAVFDAESYGMLGVTRNGSR